MNPAIASSTALRITRCFAWVWATKVRICPQWRGQIRSLRMTYHYEEVRTTFGGFECEMGEKSWLWLWKHCPWVWQTKGCQNNRPLPWTPQTPGAECELAAASPANSSKPTDMSEEIHAFAANNFSSLADGGCWKTLDPSHPAFLVCHCPISSRHSPGT